MVTRLKDTATQATGATDRVATAWRAIAAVNDPELPFLSVIDLGIVREVFERDGVVIARITPTYTGCPATRTIERDIERALARGGLDGRVECVLSPAWTTAWLTASGRRKLRENGICPPDEDGVAVDGLFANAAVTCPRCGVGDATRISSFGSTPCKALYQCQACLEPFDYFKCH